MSCLQPRPSVEEQREKLRWEAVRYGLDHAPTLFRHLAEHERGQYNWSVGARAGRTADQVRQDLQHALLALGKAAGSFQRARDLVDIWDSPMLEQFKVQVRCTLDAHLTWSWPHTPQKLEDVVAAIEEVAAGGAEW